MSGFTEGEMEAAREEYDRLAREADAAVEALVIYARAGVSLADAIERVLSEDGVACVDKLDKIGEMVDAVRGDDTE